MDLNATEWQRALKEVEIRVGHTFRLRSLLEEALTHSSYSNEKLGEGIFVTDNERLEFLGDAVIGLVVGELLMEAYPDACEGNLSRWRSALVSRRALAEIASDIGLGAYLRFGVGESRTGGSEKRSILAGALESVVGALYRDAGLDVCRVFLERIFEGWVVGIGNQMVENVNDNKTELQEAAHSHFRQVPAYRLMDSWGPEHAKTFRVSVAVEELGEYMAVGRSKKEAEQVAAGMALEALRAHLAAVESTGACVAEVTSEPLVHATLIQATEIFE